MGRGRGRAVLVLYRYSGGHSMASGGLILISHGSRTESEFHRNPAIFAYQVRVPYFPRAIGISNSKTSVRAAYDY